MRPPPPLRPLLARPSLTFGLLTGLLTFVLSGLFSHLAVTTRVIASWDLGVLCCLGIAFGLMMRRVDSTQLAKRAAELDENAPVILAVSLIAAGAAVMAVAVELLAARHEHGGSQALRLSLAAATVILSWTFVHQMFAVHYAHEFYAGRSDKVEGAPKKRKDGLRGGLLFPGGDDTPGYWDFVHFAFVIGVAAQTADVQIESRAIRQMVTVHGIIAFLFNTVILAMSINLASSLFSG